MIRSPLSARSNVGRRRRLPLAAGTALTGVMAAAGVSIPAAALSDRRTGKRGRD